MVGTRRNRPWGGIVSTWMLCLVVAVSMAMAQQPFGAGNARGQEDVPSRSPSDLDLPSQAGPARQAGPTPDGPGDAPAAALKFGENVADVRIEGNRAVPTGKIFRHLRTRAGLPLSPEVVQEDVRRLVSKEKFVDVRTVYENSPDGVIVTFRVVERPTLSEVTYLGNKKIKAKTLAKETGLSVGAALDLAQIAEGRRKIEELYHSKGFNHVQVTIQEGTAPEHRRAIYAIQEGPQQVVEHVNFVGNKIVTAARLRTLLQTKTIKVWLFGGKYKPDDLAGDVDRLVAYYHALGFWDVRVGREVEFNESQSWVTVTFVIDEGVRFKIRNISFVGNKKFNVDELMKEVEMRSGEFFDQGRLQKDQQSVKDLYGGLGHVFCNVRADARYLEEPGQMDLVYQVEEGARYRVGRIDVQINGDNPHTKLTAVLNRISLRPGDIVDIRELRASERRLKASGLFMNTGPISPKIVFSPPEVEAIGSRPGGPARGQSPDRWASPHPASGQTASGHTASSAVPIRGQSPDPTGQDVWLELRMQGQWATAGTDDTASGRALLPDSRVLGRGELGRGELWNVEQRDVEFNMHRRLDRE